MTALRMRFPKDQVFVFDVEYSYRVDDVFTDFSQVRLTVDIYWMLGATVMLGASTIHRRVWNRNPAIRSRAW